MMTCCRVPTLRFSRRAEIFCCRAISAFQRSCLISSGTALPIAFDGGARDRLVFEAADAIDLGFFEPVEQIGKIGIGLAGEADDEGRAQRQLRTLLAPLLDPRQRLVLRGRALHGLEDFRARVLEGDIEIGQHLALGHQADDLVDMRVGVDILQPHPGAELAEFFGEVEEFGADLAVLPRALGIFDIDAVGRGVLRNDQQFLDAGG